MRDDFTHQCEVRDVLRRFIAGGDEWMAGFMEKVRKARGDALADALLAEVKEQHRLGNKGEYGDWRESMREAA